MLSAYYENGRIVLSQSKCRIPKHHFDCRLIIIYIHNPCYGRYPFAGIFAGRTAVIYLHILCAFIQHDISIMCAMQRLKESYCPSGVFGNEIIVFRQTQFGSCRIIADYRDLHIFLRM